MPISLITITNRYIFENAVASLLQKYVHLAHPVPSTKVQRLRHLIQILMTYQFTWDLNTGL